MSRAKLFLTVFLLSALVAAAIVWACGAPPPQSPPPPPPQPPIVCCVIIKRYPHPFDPNRQRAVVRYFRQDGRPLYQSNPMPLLPTQKCLCSLPNLPLSAVNAGVFATRMTFGSFFGDAPCDGPPDDIPGYGPFHAEDDPSIVAQVEQFTSIYRSAAVDVTPPANPRTNALFSFAGPGTIPPNSFFDVFVELDMPMEFDPRQLTTAGQMWMMGLFLVNNGQVLAEPVQPGLAPLPLPVFQTNPGQSAFYKLKYYPVIVPRPCRKGPPPCIADVDDGSGTGNPDGGVTIDDLLYFLFRFERGC